MIFGWVIKILLTVGLSEGRAIAVAQSRWIGKALAALALAGSLVAGGWYLTELGGDWREASIRDAWDAKFAAVERDGERLASERLAMNAGLAERVREAIAAMPVVLPPLPVEPAPVVLPGCPEPAPVVVCAIPASAAKKYNAIGR